MATMAGLLRVKLSKPGHYELGDATAPLGPTTIDEAWRTVKLAAWILAALVGLWLYRRHGFLV